MVCADNCYLQSILLVMACTKDVKRSTSHASRPTVDAISRPPCTAAQAPRLMPAGPPLMPAGTKLFRSGNGFISKEDLMSLVFPSPFFSLAIMR